MIDPVTRLEPLRVLRGSRRARWLRWASLLAASCAVGCHTMRFEVSSEPATHEMHHRKSFFLWGLTPTREVDVSEFCPYGVAAIREETSFSDGFFGFITLGIWQPRSSWYACLGEKVLP
jgi:hypothetical protein